MILRHALLLLSLFLCSSPVKAMEKEEKDTLLPTKTVSTKANIEDWKVINPSDMQQVTIRMWKNPNESENGAHISVETPQHYMSLHPVSKKVENRGYLCYESPCFASPNSRIDQLIQDRKLKGEAPIGFNGESATWPCETISLNLQTTPMNKMWEGLLAGASPEDFDSEFRGMVLKNVHYSNDEMRKSFRGYIDRNDQPSRSETVLYFTNTSLTLGLLIKGKIFGENIYYLNRPKYFTDELSYWSLPYILQEPGETIKGNFYLRSENPSVPDISGFFPDFFKRQELMRIEKRLEDYKIPSLPAPRRAAIIKMIDNKKSQDEIDQKVSEFNTICHNQQKYSSPTGWINYIFYNGEW